MIKSRAAPHRTNEEAVGVLTDDVHEATAEADVPREVREASVGGRRPVAGPGDEARKGRIDRQIQLPVIHDALQLLDVRDPPVAVPRMPAPPVANARTVRVAR